MGYSDLLLPFVTLLPAVFSAAPPGHQSLGLNQDQTPSSTSAALASQSTDPGGAVLTETYNLSSASNLSLLAGTPVTCFKNAPPPWPPYRSIVFEDCTAIFYQLFRDPNVLSRRFFDGKAPLWSWRTQFGNCIMAVIQGPHAESETFSEFEIGVAMAEIVEKCVRAETDYRGGMGEFRGERSDWWIKVAAEGSFWS